MKKQVLGLSAPEIKRLKRLAEELGKSEGDLVLQAVRDFLASHDGQGYEKMEYSPLWGIVGMVEDPDAPQDGSLNHDHYIYGGPKKYHRTPDGKWERVIDENT